MATKAGVAYVEVKYDPDSIRRLRSETKAEGEKIAHSWKEAENGLIDFDRAAQKVNRTMSGGPFGLFDAIGNVGYALLKMGGFAQDGEKSLGALFTTASDGEGIMAGLGSALTSLAPLAGVAAAGFVALGAALLVLPALAAAATFVLTALLDTVTILSAVLVAFAGPVLVVTSLLGGLGAAFAYVAAQSFKNKATQQQIHDNLLALHVAQQTYNEDVKKYGKNATTTERALLALHKAQELYDTSTQGAAINIGELQDKFKSLVATLSQRFRPELVKLGDAANTALSYLGRIAKLPLAEAFRSLGTEGVAMLNKFVYGVANVLKKPFRLAIQVAFGAGGANTNQAIASWWDSLTKYLFGYTKSKPIHIGSMIVIEKKNIQGALQPMLDFFNRQHFVKTGLRWAGEIIDGVVRLWHHDKGLRDAVRAIFKDAGHMAAKAFKAAFSDEIHSIPWRALGWWLVHKLDLANGVRTAASQAWNLFKQIAGRAWDWVKTKGLSIWHSIISAAGNAASAAGNAIKNALGNAWDWVRSKVNSVWNYIKHLVESALTVHINWPSVPSSISSVLGAGGSVISAAGGLLHRAGGGPVMAGGSYMVGERGPELFTPSTSGMITPNSGPMAFNFYLDGKLIDVRVEAANQQTARRLQAGRKW